MDMVEKVILASINHTDNPRIAEDFTVKASWIREFGLRLAITDYTA